MRRMLAPTLAALLAAGTAGAATIERTETPLRIRQLSKEEAEACGPTALAGEYFIRATKEYRLIVAPGDTIESIAGQLTRRFYPGMGSVPTDPAGLYERNRDTIGAGLRHGMTLTYDAVFPCVPQQFHSGATALMDREVRRSELMMKYGIAPPRPSLRDRLRAWASGWLD